MQTELPANRAVPPGCWAKNARSRNIWLPGRRLVFRGMNREIFVRATLLIGVPAGLLYCAHLLGLVSGDPAQDAGVLSALFIAWMMGFATLGTSSNRKK